ncbi:MAG: citramalate synthase [Deltaproteobacteria bacterium]|nr:citramalate synthase [Deltaproteobacteria bacterium]
MSSHPPKVAVFDTTLRDGAQTEGISFSCEDKLRIARRLDEFGIAFIEAGWPGSNPKDLEFFERAARTPWTSAKIVAFGATRRRGIQAREDGNLQALVAAGTEVCSLVGKTWTLHVTDVLRVDLDENLRMIEESVAFLRESQRRVIYDAEHFFEGYRANPDYAIATLKAAAKGGAETLVLCETNGGAMPWDVEDIVRRVKAAVDTPLGVHCHNDGEVAVANSIAAIRAGASQVQGTINGIGERCGNANLCAIIPNLQLKLGVECVPEASLKTIYDLAHFVAEVANVSLNEQMAYVGRSAFAHKGGIHVAAMRRNERAYQHVEPEQVGNTMRVVVSELSGRGNLLSKAEELGLSTDVEQNPHVTTVLDQIKELEAEGFSFEAAEASVALMLSRQAGGYVAPFQPVNHTVMVENRSGRSHAQAMVKIDIKGEQYHTAGDGDGPVEALDVALRRALSSAFPEVKSFHLVDYKVRILDTTDGTSATTRVLIDTRCGERTWSTVGASKNIIEASWRALLDGYEYGLIHGAKGQV